MALNAILRELLNGDREEDLLPEGSRPEAVGVCLLGAADVEASRAWRAGATHSKCSPLLRGGKWYRDLWPTSTPGNAPGSGSTSSDSRVTGMLRGAVVPQS